MPNSYFKKVSICVLAAFLSFSAKSQEPKLSANHLKIVYFGSSVPYGQGATNHKGYTSLFSDILKNRVSASGNAWETVNISIGGDNTVKVLNRYKTDLLPQNGKYVIFALALGNEGIHEKGQPMFDQFEKNIKILIDKARSDGYTPVITNSYTRNDYNERDYSFIKKMNLLIHKWEVPSINLLGAIDDLSGHWVNGFWDDGLHPNDAGHAEMAYTIVPSLFDALENKKPTPKTVKGSYIKSAKNRSGSKSLAFAPEHIVHAFTTAVSFKTGDPGVLLQLSDAAGTGTISVSKEGRLVYSSARSGVVSGTSIVNDDKWHKVIVTHYYAKGVTMLYCDSTLQGTLAEKLVTTGLRIGGTNIPKKLAYKNWLFYRSGMNPDEIKYLAKDSLLKSSLELYAPLDGKKVSVSDPLINLAQSMNVIKEVK
jgi:lysophospholipase L1-like esterase